MNPQKPQLADIFSNPTANGQPSLEQIFNQGVSSQAPRVTVAPPNQRLSTGSTEQDTSLFGRLKEGVSDVIQTRGQQFADSKERQTQGGQTGGETALQFAGQTVGATFDILGVGLTELLKLTPDKIKETVGTAGQAFLETPAGQAGLQALSSGMETYQSWKEENPRAAANLEAVGNIASVVPVTRGGKALTQPAVTATKGTTKQVARLGTGVSKVIDERTISNELKTAVDLTRPILSANEKKSAFASGRGKFSGVTKELELAPTRRELDIAEVSKPFIKKDLNKTVISLNDEVSRLDKSIVQNLKNNDGIFNDKELRSTLSAIKDDNRIVFGGDKAIEKAYDTVIDEIFNHLDKNNLSSLFAARKKFDRVVNDKFPKTFDGSPTDLARTNAILDVRRGVNDYISSRLPEGSPFKEVLRKESLLLTARDNIAENLSKSLGSNVVKRTIDTIRKNPVVATGGAVGIGFGLGTGTIVSILSSPWMVGSLLTLGSVNVAGKVIKSEAFRKALRNVAKGMDNMPAPDKRAMEILIDAFGAGGIGALRNEINEE